MGFGGILAAMASGLGTGMVKNAENMWKEVAAQKEMDWRSEESEKNRQHDFKTEDQKHQNNIALAAFQAQNEIRVAKEKYNMMQDSQTKAFQDIQYGLVDLNKNIDQLTQSLSNTALKGAEREKVLNELARFKKEKELFTQGEAFQSVYNNTSPGGKLLLQNLSGQSSPAYQRYKKEEEEKANQKKALEEQAKREKIKAAELAEQKAGQSRQEAMAKYYQSQPIKNSAFAYGDKNFGYGYSYPR